MMRTFQPTYFAQASDGTFYETTEGRGSYDVIVSDIAEGQYEVERVFRARTVTADNKMVFEDVTSTALDAVYELLHRRGPGPIPSFVKINAPDDVEWLRRAWLSPAERRAEDEANEADRARDDRRAA